MPLSVRDITVPPDEVLTEVKTVQITLYLSLIPTTIITYDFRAFSLQNLFKPSLNVALVCTLYKEVCQQKSSLRLYGDGKRLADQVLLGG